MVLAEYPIILCPQSSQEANCNSNYHLAEEKAAAKVYTIHVHFILELEIVTWNLFAVCSLQFTN